jgi:hypothetical protein
MSKMKNFILALQDPGHFFHQVKVMVFVNRTVDLGWFLGDELVRVRNALSYRFVHQNFAARAIAWIGFHFA